MCISIIITYLRELPLLYSLDIRWLVLDGLFSYYECIRYQAL